MDLSLKQTEKKETSGTKDINQLTTISVEQIPCYSSIGIHEEEKKMGQRLFIDVSVDLDTEETKNDSIAHTLNYVDIYKIVQESGKAKSYNLIETLAEEIAKEILKHALVIKTKIKVRKPHIPFPDFSGNVSVEIERTKKINS